MRSAPKVAINLSARADMVREAKTLGLNLSEVFEAALAEAIRRRRRELWLKENRDAIAGYNPRVERAGSFSDDWRKFLWPSSTSSRIRGARRTRSWSNGRASQSAS